MTRAALNTDDIKIDDVATITGDMDNVTDIVEADAKLLADKEHMEKLAFNEEPVTIEIWPSSDRNPPTHYFCQVNGYNPEVLHNGRWSRLLDPYVKVGQQVTTKRKYVAVLVQAKTIAIRTQHDDIGTMNNIIRTPSAVANVQILEDKNPKGVPYFSELRRRAY